MVSSGARETKAEVVERLLHTSQELNTRGEKVASAELMWGALHTAQQ